MNTLKDMEGGESGHVSPIMNCPHVELFLKDTDNIDVQTACVSCKDTTENWICLTCYSVGCCRFKNAHALSHFQESKHPISLSFSDLSTWCYECEAYIRNPKLSHVFSLAHESKFKATPENPSTTYYITKNSGLTEEEIKEYFDEPEEVQKKVKELANMIRQSKYMLAYTGAGVSTSAKIPDYRGPQGIWTLRDKGQSPHFEVTLEQALPTPTHMSLLELYKNGILKFLVSTNVDGLHRRSGIPEKGIAELHGNCYLERCLNVKCKKEFLRTFDASSGRDDHRTGRKCDACNEPLFDSIINFGENLPINELEKTAFEVEKSDLSLVLGTSMRVSPANQFPLQVLSTGGKLVIVNLQKTPYDKKAHLIIRERTDKVMELLFKELGMEIPVYNEDEDGIKKRQ